MQDYLESFTRQVCTRETMTNGGCREVWSDGGSFMGKIVTPTASEMKPGGMPSAAVQGILYHDGSTRLAFHDRVKRNTDGTVWRVGGVEVRVPAKASFIAAYVPVERTVTA